MNTRDKIKELCKNLKLSERMADRAMTAEGNTNQEYLINLFEAEVTSRRTARIVKKLNRAKFPYEENFDDFDPGEVVFPEGLTVDDCRTLKFVNEKHNILMYGNSGTGKTMLSICIGFEACRNDIHVRFYRTEDLINQLKAAHREGSLNTFKNQNREARILILDEFGYLPYDLEGAQLLFNFISEFYQRSSIIVTTNKEFSEWQDILSDQKLTKAFVGRIVHRCDLIMFPGEDRRIRDSNIAKMYRTLMNETQQEEQL